jgi:hypothetical protein
MKVSTAFNYFRDKEHIVTYYLPNILTIGLILATRETNIFAHLTVPKQQMFDQTFVSQPQNIEVVWREKSKQLLIFEIPSFHIGFQRFKKYF